MKLYNYDRVNGEFISVSEARENPLLKGEYLIPSNSTTIMPLEAKESFTVCFIEGGWKYVEDNRGKTSYNIEDRSAQVVEYLGPIKENYTLNEPQSTQIWEDGWVEDVDLLRTQKLQEFETKYLVESLKDVVYQGVSYKGGLDSASAINGAILLSSVLDETEVNIISVDDNSNLLTFEEASELAKLVAKAWRDVFYVYKDLKVQVNESLTSNEIELIEWSDEVTP